MSAFGKTFGRFLQAPTFPLELEQVAVMHQPIEERGNDDDIALEFTRFRGRVVVSRP